MLGTAAMLCVLELSVFIQLVFMGIGVSKPLNVLWSAAPPAPLWGRLQNGPQSQSAPHAERRNLFFCVKEVK